jgi:hypothetical protein
MGSIEEVESCFYQLVWWTYLGYLPSPDERFYLFDADLTSNIAKCFKNVVDQDILISTLKLLSETGFVPLKDVDDPLAELVSRNNVAGVVKKASVNVGLPDSVWDNGCKYGLVPTSQSTRLLIAEYLFHNEYVK